MSKDSRGIHNTIQVMPKLSYNKWDYCLLMLSLMAQFLNYLLLAYYNDDVHMHITKF